MTNNNTVERKPAAYLSPLAVLAFSIGTSVGWGSLVVTSNNYLAQSGPLGSVLGLLIGTVVMAVIARNYSYMIKNFPESGGAYSYTRDALGYDHGFLTAWFLSLTYLAMLWANATSLPLFAKYFVGDVFRVGKMYTLFGYDVYIGEALLTISAILLIAVLCMRSKKITSYLMIAMAFIFVAGIVLCFVAGIIGHKQSLSPAFVPDKNAFGQIIKIACLSPWAFIGFESVSHGAEEYSFKRSKIYRILIAAVITTVVLYIAVTLLSVTAYPEEYATWLDYINDLKNLDGIKGLPAFYAAYSYLGNAGIGILMAALLALVISSLIGNIFALSRLFYALGQDRVLPEAVSKLNSRSIPSKAIMLIAAVSVVVPFLGRTAIGWIVDVTTLGATLTYGLVSFATAKIAKTRDSKHERVTGIIGVVMMVLFGAYMLVPNLFSEGSMEKESYFLFVVWSVIGFGYFRYILKRDKERRFGKSIIVWIALLSLVLFVSLVWMSKSNMQATSDAMSKVQQHYVDNNITDDQKEFIDKEMSDIRATNGRSLVVVVAVFALSVGILLNNYAIMSKRAQTSEAELFRIKDFASKDPLTGTKSKHAYYELEKTLNKQIAEKNISGFGIVVCDINGLKYVNDTSGHKAGDAYIIKAAHVICELFKHSPVFRIGGDEFVIYLTGKDYENRTDILDKLQTLSVRNIKTSDVVVSAGIAEFDPGSDIDLRAVFERADALMYENKKQLKELGAITR